MLHWLCKKVTNVSNCWWISYYQNEKICSIFTSLTQLETIIARESTLFTGWKWIKILNSEIWVKTQPIRFQSERQMAERSQTNATNVILHSLRQAIWGQKYFDLQGPWKKVLTYLKKSLYTIQADPEKIPEFHNQKSRDFDRLKIIIYIIVVFNSDNYVPVLDNHAPIENITSFGQFCPNYGQLNIFTFNGTLFDYTYPFNYTYPLYYPYHKVDNYVLFSIHHQGGRHHHHHQGVFFLIKISWTLEEVLQKIWFSGLCVTLIMQKSDKCE